MAGKLVLVVDARPQSLSIRADPTGLVSVLTKWRLTWRGEAGGHSVCYKVGMEVIHCHLYYTLLVTQINSESM